MSLVEREWWVCLKCGAKYRSESARDACVEDHQEERPRWDLLGRQLPDARQRCMHVGLWFVIAGAGGLLGAAGYMPVIGAAAALLFGTGIAVPMLVWLSANPPNRTEVRER